MPSAQHSSASNEHYTPEAIIKAARATMAGGIDLDPASNAFVNSYLIKALDFYGEGGLAPDGLKEKWHGNVWLNPPGGRVGSRSSAAVWWNKLVQEYEYGDVEQAIFLGFSIEILATAQDSELWPGYLPFCVPRHRLEFLKVDECGYFVEGTSPTHSNIIVYLPPRDRTRSEALERFYWNFNRFGKITFNGDADGLTV